MSLLLKEVFVKIGRLDDRLVDEARSKHYNAIIMQRKLIKVGTSAAVLVPKAVLEEHRVNIGDTMEVRFYKKNASLSQDVNPAVLVWTEKLRKRYKPVLKKLSSS